VRAALPLFHVAPPRDHQSDGHSRSQAFRQRHDVGRDAPVLAGEHLAGTPDARLHFVEDEQDAVPVTQLAQALQEASVAPTYPPSPWIGSTRIAATSLAGTLVWNSTFSM